jgi:DNA-binding MarR family transcriptional regulator
MERKDSMTKQRKSTADARSAAAGTDSVMTEVATPDEEAPAGLLPQEMYFTDRFVPYLINHVASLFNLQFKKDLRMTGMSVMQWRVLAVLRGAPGLSLREISDKTAIDQPTLSRVIDQLDERKLIERAARLSDGRYLALSLTAAGDELFERLWQLAWKHYQRGTHDLTAAESEQLVVLLQKTLASLRSA